MTGGEQSFLQGLSDISSTILKDMSGIYQLRTQTALENAKAKIGLAEVDFKYKIQKGEINPTNFDEKFGEYQSSLAEFANSSEYEPAKDAILAYGNSTLPQLKALSYVEIMKSESVKSMYSTFDTIETIRNTPGKTADEIYVGSTAALETLYGKNGVTQEQYLQKKAEIEGTHRGDKTLEVLKNLSYSEKIAKLNNPDDPLLGSIGVREAERLNILDSLQKKHKLDIEAISAQDDERIKSQQQ
jgi:hypothetical protein